MINTLPKYLMDALKKYCDEFPKCNGCVFQTYGGCWETFDSLIPKEYDDIHPQRASTASLNNDKATEKVEQ